MKVRYDADADLDRAHRVGRKTVFSLPAAVSEEPEGHSPYEQCPHPFALLLLTSLLPLARLFGLVERLIFEALLFFGHHASLIRSRPSPKQNDEPGVACRKSQDPASVPLFDKIDHNEKTLTPTRSWSLSSHLKVRCHCH